MTASEGHTAAEQEMIYYVAKLQGETRDPIQYLSAKGVGGGFVNELFAKATGDVFVPVIAQSGREGAFVFSAPTISGQPWKVFYTSEPEKQGECFGDDGPLTNYKEAVRVAGEMSKNGGAYAVFSFTPSSKIAPIVMH